MHPRESKNKTGMLSALLPVLKGNEFIYYSEQEHKSRAVEYFRLCIFLTTDGIA